MSHQKVTFFWFRRDLRLQDNTALFHALNTCNPVILLFIFDEEILDNLPKNDARVSFIHQSLQKINTELQPYQSSILIKKGNPIQVWKSLMAEYAIENVFFNKDYEPYAKQRDFEVTTILKEKHTNVYSYKDHVFFEENEILKPDQKPYTIYTPYKNKWLEKFYQQKDKEYQKLSANYPNLLPHDYPFPSLAELGFEESQQKVLPYQLDTLTDYDQTRDFPAIDSSSYLSPHLRFGTVSIRELVYEAESINATFLSELIWRDFFIQILYHFPKSVTHNFKSAYDSIEWKNNANDFKKWCNGNTGYPMVDAGMRQLNETGYMHNRVRMVVASFLCKHLLIQWQWGEAYFAEKLLDYELASNVGNWQWAAGTGCDAAPYFRVFNPNLQLKKFDSDLKYTRKWVPEFDWGYTEPMIDHDFARNRAISTYKKGLEK